MTAMAGVLLLTAALAAGPQAPPDPFQSFAEEATGWLLSGQRLPRDYRLRLLEMPPADRLRAIAYLRRLGLLTDRPWPLADLLRPAPVPEIPE